MFSHLLVPLDGSAQSATALPLVRTLARIASTRVTLLRAVPRTEGDAVEWAQQMKDADDYLARVADEVRRNDLPVEGVTREGHPATAIVRAARELGADGIVMTTHGRSGLKRAMLGSVTEEVLRHSPVPVVAVRPGGRRMTALKTLLVPVDGTPGGTVALGQAVALARAANARVVLVQAVAPLPAYVYEPVLGGGVASPIDPAWEEDAVESARHYLASLASRLDRNQVSAETRVVRGQAAEEIIRVADEVDADLIVMSTHALTGARRALLGSVADAVVRESQRPVLLVRRDAEDAAGKGTT